ncbi:hypothetical protein H7K24_19195 [Mycobacterium fragae]|jgi:hypothetical protein|uniref:Uncharacterized protein n=1 Tax=Mycobacterium fragae TaxID=1260918 RepID=A0A1X1US18_9MYCO|nr:hypothetical protein [Mycobacterium fragae]MCV7402266.1 hypothetical protein [Mycobacterium fragae]ORV59655.1 hypothetical protein AWC06_16135 [Mycobacterium fragae]
MRQSASALALARVGAVRDDPDARLALLRDEYRVPSDVDRGYLPFRQAASAFMKWQLRRGLLNPADSPRPGSPWWRAMNERLLRDGCEARALAFGHPGPASSPTVGAWLEFVRHPTAASWYRAHNMSVVSAYLEHEHLASRERRVERFFINLVLVRVLYAHALVAAPRLALGWLAPAGRLLGDPRLGMTGIFLSLTRVLPDRYPLGDDVTPYAQAEHGMGHLLDVGVIQPRVERLYAWSADELDMPGLRQLVSGQTPCYAWPAADQQPWDPAPSRVARLARRVLPATSR